MNPPWTTGCIAASNWGDPALRSPRMLQKHTIFELVKCIPVLRAYFWANCSTGNRSTIERSTDSFRDSHWRRVSHTADITQEAGLHTNVLFSEITRLVQAGHRCLWSHGWLHPSSKITNHTWKFIWISSGSLNDRGIFHDTEPKRYLAVLWTVLMLRPYAEGDRFPAVIHKNALCGLSILVGASKILVHCLLCLLESHLMVWPKQAFKNELPTLFQDSWPMGTKKPSWMMRYRLLRQYQLKSKQGKMQPKGMP